MTGIGPVDIKVPKTRDRGGQGIHLRSELLPQYIKGTKSNDDAKQCILVIIGVTIRGNNEFLAIEDGYRNSEQSWTEVLLSLKSRGFRSPKLAMGDGALGFWKATRKVFGETRSQRCWVHKTANILNKLPKYSQAKAKQYIHDIRMAETRENA